jgi:hypothetical protein
MKLVFEGHAKSRTIKVAKADLARYCRGFHGSTGCFRHMGSWSENNGVLTVKFQPTIYLNNTLTGKEKDNALSHENRHYKDFKGRAVQLQTALSRAIRARKDPQMEARWEWFFYDLCTDSAAFHRSIRMMVEICMTPSVKRP